MGEIGFTGEPDYTAKQKFCQWTMYLYIFMAKQTKPGRKMGHATILSNEKYDLYMGTKIKHLL